MPKPEVTDTVADEEVLYRSIRPTFRECYIKADGEPVLSTEAFNDRNSQVSVYRKHLCDDPPSSNLPRLGQDQAVVSALAADIRLESPIQHKPEKKESTDFLVDIQPDPDVHPAHAIITTSPAPISGVFKKLKLRLRTVFKTWDIKPDPAITDVR